MLTRCKLSPFLAECILSQSAVIQSDGGGHKGASESFSPAPGWDELWLKELPIRHSSSCREDKDCLDFVPHPPLSCCLQTVQDQNYHNYY